MRQAGQGPALEKISPVPAPRAGADSPCSSSGTLVHQLFLGVILLQGVLAFLCRVGPLSAGTGVPVEAALGGRLGTILFAGPLLTLAAWLAAALLGGRRARWMILLPAGFLLYAFAFALTLGTSRP